MSLSELLAGKAPERSLRAYFDDSPATPFFTGRRFDTLGATDVRPLSRTAIQPDDILAVQLLGVRVPGEAAIAVLEGGLGRRCSEQLLRLPADVDLWDDPAEGLVEPGGPADRLWQLLAGQQGIGWVTAGKLVARMRPRLVPVYDEVVKCLLGHQQSFWLTLRAALRAPGYASCRGSASCHAQQTCLCR